MCVYVCLLACTQDLHCVVMVEKELGSISQLYLTHPIWRRRVTVLIGTPLRIVDLQRARASSALACFIHTNRGCNIEAEVSNGW